MAYRPRSLRRLGLYSFLALAALAGLVLDVLTLGPIRQPAFASNGSPHTIPNTDVNPFGVNIFMDREVEEWKKRRTMEMIADAGIGWVKQEFSWAEIEPLKNYFFDYTGKSSWDKFDGIVDLAEEYGLEVIARVDRPPAWARAEGSNPESPPVDPHTYADFIYRFVDHYKGRIHYLQVWNEPNLDNEWVLGQPVDSRGYVTLLRLAYEQAKAADPDIQILSAPLAARTTDDPNRVALSDLTYLEEMYRAGAGAYFDILSANAYGFNFPPETPPDPGQLNFRRVELVRIIMEKHGDEKKPIWFHEYGWNAAPADMPAAKLLWGRVSEEEQALWTVQGIAFAREHWPWAGVFCIWYFRQVGDYPQTDAAYYFRMVNVDFTPLPVYSTVRQAAGSLAIATPGGYEETAAPVQRRGGWLSRYSSSASGGSYVESSAPDSTMALTFLGTDLGLRVRRGPDGGRLLVTVDGVAGRGSALPRDDLGHAYLDLYSPAEEWVDFPLIRGLGRELPAQVHRLELSVAEGKSLESLGHLCAVDAFEVSYHRSYLIFWISTGVLIAGTGLALVLFVLELRRPSPPHPRRAPINPWTLQPEQLGAPEDSSTPAAAEPEGPSLPPTEEA